MIVLLFYNNKNETSNLRSDSIYICWNLLIKKRLTGVYWKLTNYLLFYKLYSSRQMV